MLPTNELNSIRSDIEALCLPDTCTVLSKTRTSDGMGSGTEGYGTITASVKCRLDAKQGTEELAGGGQRSYFKYILTVPHDTTVTSDYVILHGGIYYNIVSVDSNKSLDCTRRLMLERIA